MSNILIVDHDEELSRRVQSSQHDVLYTKHDIADWKVTSWSDFATQIRRHASLDMVVLNLEAPSAPPLREAVHLRDTQPNWSVIYYVDLKGDESDQTLAALSQPGSSWVSSKASDEELQLRVRSLISWKEHLQSHPVVKTQGRSQSLHLMPELHNPHSGRLDAAHIAEWFGMPLKTLAIILKRGYAAVHKTPDAPTLQENLQVFLRLAMALSHLAGSHQGAKVWLNTPNPDLENNQTPLSAIEMGEQEIIAELLEDALYGQPG